MDAAAPRADGASSDAGTRALRGDVEAALAVLEQHLRRGCARIALIGPPGCGKTLLLRTLLVRIEKDFYAAHLPVPSLMPAEILAWLANFAVGLEPRGGDTLEDVARACAQRERPLALLIDDADAMPVDVATALAATLARTGDTLILVLVFLDADDGRVVPVPMDHRAFQHLLEGEACGPDELIGRSVFFNGDLTFLD